jgi:formate dehydrogenase subunit gamma
MPHHSLEAHEELAVLDELLADLAPDAEHLLPFLHRVQERLGHVSPAAIRYAAHAFNLSRAEVFGVVTFYGDFREAPVGETVVQLCMAEACQAVGCRALAAHAESSLGATLGHTSRDGRVHLEAVYCLGNCALGPAVRIGTDIHGRVTADVFDELLLAATTRRAT